MERSAKQPISATRKQYIFRLVGRCAVLVAAFVCYFLCPRIFSVIEGFNFFKSFSPLHLLWAVWVFDMVLQILPIKSKIALGSKKLFLKSYRPKRGKINTEALKKYITTTTAAAYRVLLLWGALVAVIAVLYYCGVLDKTWLFLLSVVFYVCDLICVLIWCPFRLLMKTKCCTTCRIFNWDHLMMFSPIVFAGGFYAVSLFAMALVAWLVWELCVLIYPERFWEITNASLACCECTDKLCTQYCQKLRVKKRSKQ